MLLPVAIGDFTDFLRLDLSRHQCRPRVPARQSAAAELQIRAGRLSRPRLVGARQRYAGEAPAGPAQRANEPAPSYGPSRNLDFELELGMYIGTPTALGETVPVGKAAAHHFRILPAQRLVGARHAGVGIPAARPVSRQEFRDHRLALGGDAGGAGAVPRRGFRAAGRAIRRRCRISPIADDQAHGGLDITLEAYLATEAMRRAGHGAVAAHAAPRSRRRIGPWRRWSRITPATAAILSPAISSAPAPCPGRRRESWGSLLELTARGREPIALPTGEQRGFIEDGDEIIFKGFCSKQNYPRIGFGECRAVLLPAS